MDKWTKRKIASRSEQMSYVITYTLLLLYFLKEPPLLRSVGVAFCIIRFVIFVMDIWTDGAEKDKVLHG